MSTHAQRTARSVDPRAQWADYTAPRSRSKYQQRTHFHVTFADGELVRVSHPSDSRKAYNFGPAARIAATFWKMRRAGQWANAKRLKGERRILACEQYERTLIAPSILKMRVFLSTEGFWK